MAAVDIIRNQSLASFVIANAELVKGRVLDVGCGSQPYKRMFPECEWTGVDIRPVGDVEADMASLPFEDNTFDTVLAIDCLNFTHRPTDVVGEWARVLKPGGVLICLVRTTADDDSVFLGIHTSGLVQMMKDAGLVGLSDAQERNVSLSGLFSRAESDNFWTNHTWLEGVQNGDLDRFCTYLDKRYPLISGVCSAKE